MTLRRFLVLAILCSLLQPSLSVGSRAATQPNFLIVVTDDQSLDSEMAIPDVISWMTREFTQAYATTPQCCPSRASILSGRYSHNHGVLINRGARQFDLDKTMVHDLQAAGYRTGMAGKYFNRWDGRRPADFDTWSISQEDVAYRHAKFNQKRNTVVARYGPNHVFTFGRQTLRRWEKADADPWLLMLNPSTPHPPFEPEKRFARRRFPSVVIPAETDRSDKHPYVSRSHVIPKKGHNLRRQQLRSLLTVNREFNRLMRYLDSSGELANTYVVFISDNGVLQGQHGLERKAHAYLPAVHVPMYLREPTGGPLVADNRIVANVDVAPTVFELSGVTPSYTVDGWSLLGPHVRTELLLEHNRDGGGAPAWRSILDATGHYIRYLDGFEEFYDLTTDPDELTGIAAPGSYPDRLTTYETCVGTACP
jgi:arylsulfatase A-like enzyme